LNRKGPSFTVTTSSTSLHLLDQYLHDDVEEEEATEDEDDEDEGEESVVAHEGRLILEVIHDEDERSAEGEELTKVKNVRRHVRRGEEEEFPEREEDEKVREGEGREEGGREGGGRKEKRREGGRSMYLAPTPIGLGST